jgi:isoquinoline 1-oxidoreductase beta subunit
MNPSRREFLKLGAAAAGGLLLELAVDGTLRAEVAFAARSESVDAFRPFAWLAIEPSGRTLITIGRVEMGQGTRTSLPMLVAEELDADWSLVEVETAMPGPDFQDMRTSGSWSVGGRYGPLRQMGARARAMLVAAAAARWGVSPDDCVTEPGRVRHPPSGRSLGYGELAPDAARIPVPPEAALKQPEQFRLIGHPVARRDAPRIVNGSAGYGLDVRVPGMRFASIERCSVTRGRLRTLDDSAARHVPGVRDVVRLGESVAVVGDHTWAALAGRRALRTTWDEGTVASFDSRAFRLRLAEASNGRGSLGRSVGDADAALAQAARRLEALYEYPFFVHAPLEPMNAVAHVRDGRCDLWLGTQAPNWAQEDVARRLAIDPAKVQVHVQLLGGGFGRRLGVEHAIEAAELSRAIAAPVQVVWTREDDMRHGFFQPAAAHRMSAGLDGSGRIASWRHCEASSAQNFRDRIDPHDPDLAAIHMWGGVDNPYTYPAMRAEFVLVEAPIPLGPWRAVFAPSNVMARECFLDEIAHATGKDPVTLRLDLLAAGEGADPRQEATRSRLAAVIRLVAEKAGWGRALPSGRGLGIAAHVYDGETTLAQIAEVSVAKGALRVHRFVCAIDCGPVVNPLGLAAQVESAVVWGLSQTLGGEITFRNGRIEQTGFGDYPILRLSETPTIETYTIAGAPRPLGAGEQPVAPVAAAALNAVFAATGKRIRRLPVASGDLG